MAAEKLPTTATGANIRSAINTHATLIDGHTAAITTINEELPKKQPILVPAGAEQNIKTVGGNSVLGTGDIPFPDPSGGLGIATADTNPVDPVLGNFYFAKPGLTYPNFLDETGEPIEVPLIDGLETVFDAKLAWTGLFWELIYSKTAIPPAENKILNWEPQNYDAGSQVLHDGCLWGAGIDTTSVEIPGISSKWGYLLNILKSIITDSGSLTIQDENGNTSFIIYPNGEVGISKFSAGTEQRIKTLVSGILPTIPVDKIYSKKVSILGDSISTDGAGTSPPLVSPQQYWEKLRIIQNCTIFRNAIGGTTIANSGTSDPMNSPSRWESLNSVFEPDVVILFAGVNDFLQNVPLGTDTDTTVATFYGALDYLYKSLLTRYSSSRVFHMTPLHNNYVGNGSIPEYNGTNFFSEFIEAIMIVSRRYGFGVIDTNLKSGITRFNIMDLSNDSIHVNADGHNMIYNTIIAETNQQLN